MVAAAASTVSAKPRSAARLPSMSSARCSRGDLLVASVVVPGDLDATRRMLRGLVLPGQRRLHMKDESAPRKRSIATAIAVSGTRATIYHAGRR